jgi:pyruvate dehydrogenase E1 component alpha subunit
VARGLVYTSSILGNNLSVACGYALAKKIKGESGVVFVVTGDGAIEEGAFWETLIFANSLDLRVIFIVENNEWSMSTSIEQRRCQIYLKDLAWSLRMDYGCLDNTFYTQDYIETLQVLKRHLVPAILEIKLTTLGGYEKDGRFINYHSGVVKGEVP